MGTGLLSSAGLDIKRMADILTDLELAFKAQFGENVNLSADSEIGKLCSIIADRESVLWERLETLYNSMYPGTAVGNALDRVMELTGVVRNSATPSTVTLYLKGNNALIPVNALVETVDTGKQFIIPLGATLPTEVVLTNVAEGAGKDLTQTAGTATVLYPAHGRAVGQFVWVQDCVQAGYNGVHQILTVSDVNHFTFAVDSGTVSPATGTVSMYVVTPVQARSRETGPISALAGTLTAIVTVVSGWDQVTNILDAVQGTYEETDSDARLRREASLFGLGNAAVDSIRGDLLKVQGVTRVVVFENDTDSVVSSRPAHSVECLVEGGATQDILNALFATKAGGIATYGTTTGVVTDSQGFTHTVKFSRPTEIAIWLIVTLTTDANYPADGNARVSTKILAFAGTLALGQDVVVSPYLISSFADVPGITGAVIKIGLSNPPTLADNIIITETQIAVFDSSRISIVS